MERGRCQEEPWLCSKVCSQVRMMKGHKNATDLSGCFTFLTYKLESWGIWRRCSNFLGNHNVLVFTLSYCSLWNQYRKYSLHKHTVKLDGQTYLKIKLSVVHNSGCTLISAQGTQPSAAAKNKTNNTFRRKQRISLIIKQLCMGRNVFPILPSSAEVLKSQCETHSCIIRRYAIV